MNSIVYFTTSLSNYNLARYKRLSDSQIECVIEFLRLITAQNSAYADEATQALEKYWLTPDAKRKTLIYAP